MNPNEILELMKNRRSIREYTDTPISNEDINMILEAARWCQSGSNKQPWRFIVIKNKNIIEKLAKLAKYGHFVKRAPVVIAVVSNKKVSPKWYIHDSSMAAHQICLMVSALGLGTCWIGSLDRDKGAELLGLSKDEFLTTILPIGHPQKIPKPTPRKPLEKIVSYLD
ncbi:MAG: nitroreductase family protein [Candidatus Helarchaeota archaeon]